MLCKITQGDFFKDNPEFKSIPEFTACTSRMMKYVAYMYDYDSVMRRLPLTERKDKSLHYAGFSKEKARPTVWDRHARVIINDELPQVLEAAAVYKSIQFNRDRAALDAYDEQLDDYISLMRSKDKSPKEMDQAIKISEKLPEFMAKRSELRKILGFEAISQAEEEESSMSSMSLIDKFHLKNKRRKEM